MSAKKTKTAKTEDVSQLGTIYLNSATPFKVKARDRDELYLFAKRISHNSYPFLLRVTSFTLEGGIQEEGRLFSTPEMIELSDNGYSPFPPVTSDNSITVVSVAKNLDFPCSDPIVLDFVRIRKEVIARVNRLNGLNEDNPDYVPPDSSERNKEYQLFKAGYELGLSVRPSDGKNL